jgi:MFS family permease
MLVPLMLTPGFIGTVVFFHQAHIAEVKRWSLAAMAPGYASYAGTTVASVLVFGWVCDRFGAVRLLPWLLVPMGMAMLMVGPAESVLGWFALLGVLAISQGMVQAFWGVFLPVLYGTDHLGSVRAVLTMLMVLSTAIGPGLTGVLIDLGLDFPAQGVWLAAWCFALTTLSWRIAWHLRLRDGHPTEHGGV